VENTLSGLQELAAARRQLFEGTVVALTGSNGKTIVKEWIYQCLSDQFSVHRSPKSYNSQVGVPLSVWMIGEHHKLAIIEAGMSRPGEMEKLRQIIQPGIGLFTNLGTAHQENFESLEEKLREKLLLFSGCKKVICRSDVIMGSNPLTSFLSGLKTEVVGWSIDGSAAYNYLVGKKTSSQTELRAILPSGQFSFNLPFSDDASIENALHALTFSIEVGPSC